MSTSDAAKKVKQMFKGLGRVPSPAETVGSLTVPARPSPREKVEPSAQLNLRVPASTKKRVRVLAARDNLTLSEVVMRAIDLYEETHGKAPEL